jgi:hypothetical protein
MAESIFTVLATRQTSTTVPFMGKDDNGKTISVPHTIPDELFPTDEEFESPEKLIAWSNETDCTFEMLQKGIGKALIEVRAKFKAPKLGKDKAPDTWTPEYGQENVNAMEWTPVKRPNQGNTKSVDAARYKDCMDMIVQLTENGMDVKTIKTMTTKIYCENIVEAIFDAMK